MPDGQADIAVVVLLSAKTGEALRVMPFQSAASVLSGADHGNG
ncbi:hypothetical protein ABLU92_18920 [Klebsiella sp. CN_Kp096]